MEPKYPEFLNRKNEHEHMLTTILGNMLNDFKNDFGCTPSDIKIDLVNVTPMNAKEKEYTVGKVNIIFEL